MLCMGPRVPSMCLLQHESGHTDKRPSTDYHWVPSFAPDLGLLSYGSRTPHQVTAGCSLHRFTFVQDVANHLVYPPMFYPNLGGSKAT
ncbi:hypothetical protein AAC387_Pa04g1140 [Persea americana]